MDVVGHQTIGPYSQPVALGILAKEVQIGPAVVVGVEHVGAAVPSLRDVMGKTRYDDARDSAHPDKLAWR